MMKIVLLLTLGAIGLCGATEVCYPDIGCFYSDGPMKHIGMLPQSPEHIGTKFMTYTTESPETPTDIDPKVVSSLDIIAKNSSIAIFIHGFAMNSQKDYVLKLRDSLLKYTKLPTVILVDWRIGALAPFYEEAATNTQLVGRQVAFLIETLRKTRDIDPKNVHLIGFSLGAHVSGFAGKFSQTEYKWAFGRITACDSAAPLFEDYPGSYLTWDDATYVDAIHTSAGHSVITGEEGFVSPLGHVDFYPHNGGHQPRCDTLIEKLNIVCNHESSVIYFEASVSAVNCQFKAYKCPNWQEFTEDKCTKAGDSRMGYYSNTTPGRGIHYLNAKQDYPFFDCD